MIRSIYTWLVRLHPRGFRERFGDEMLSVFDDAFASRGGAALLGDGLVSLVRQRLLRPDIEPGNSSPQPASTGVPGFTAIETSLSMKHVFAWGGVATLATFSALSFMIEHGANRRTRNVEISGVHWLADSRVIMSSAASPQSTPVAGPAVETKAREGILTKMAALASAAFSAVAQTVPDPPPPPPSTELERTVAPAPNERREGSRLVYVPHPPPPPGADFASSPVLAALDVDGDHVISSNEIENSVSALKRLDANGDGRLTPEECGVTVKPR